MFTLFIEGGAGFMSILTIVLIALLLAAWKAPAWVKEIGLIALVWGLIWSLIGIYLGAVNIERVGSIPQGVLWGGVKVTMISLFYGLFIYLVSLIIRIIQKPRI